MADTYWDQFDPAPYVVPGAKDASGNPVQRPPLNNSLPVTPGSVRNPDGTPFDPRQSSLAAPSTGPASGVAARSIKDPNAFREAWFNSPHPKNVDGLKAFVAEHPEFDVTIFGSKGSKVTIGGQQFQAVRSAGMGGGIGPAWDPLGAEGGPGIEGAGGMNLGDFGSMAKGFGKTFTAPTVEEIRATPGYQFQLTEGINALDKSAAARGTVLGGGQKKDVLEFATGLADMTANTKYEQALGRYMDAYNIFRNDNNDIFNRYDRLADRGTSAADRATS